MATTFLISSNILSWTNLDLNIINSLNISCLNLGLNKNTIKYPKYYCEGSRKLKILHQTTTSMELNELWFISYKHYK